MARSTTKASSSCPATGMIARARGRPARRGTPPRRAAPPDALATAARRGRGAMPGARSFGRRREESGESIARERVARPRRGGHASAGVPDAAAATLLVQPSVRDEGPRGRTRSTMRGPPATLPHRAERPPSAARGRHRRGRRGRWRGRIRRPRPGALPPRSDRSAAPSSESAKWRLKTLTTARATSFSTTRSSRVSSPSVSSSILPAVEATTAGRSLIRGAAAGSSSRTARFSAAAASVSWLAIVTRTLTPGALADLR